MRGQPYSTFVRKNKTGERLKRQKGWGDNRDRQLRVLPVKEELTLSKGNLTSELSLI